MNKVKTYKIAGKSCFIVWFIIIMSLAISPAYKMEKAGL